MEVATFKFRGKLYRSDAADFNSFLKSAHGEPDRPECQCRRNGIPMYVALAGQLYVIKRMPNTGSEHHPSCGSYEPPPEVSGLGEVAGRAIQVSPADGITTLKFDFALSKSGTRAAPTGGGSDAPTVTTDGKRLTLRGTLHYLMDEAGFTRWTPAMRGKRNWFVFRKYLLEAANDKTVKGHGLAQALYMPESFSVERKDQISRRRQELFNRLRVADGRTRKLMILIAEVKEFAPARFGHKLIVKHIPDGFFMLDEQLHKRMLKRFGSEIGLWQAIDGSHLLVVATFGVQDNGIATIEEASLVLADENWIPFESTDEKALIEALADRRFVKSLRYNLATAQPIASAVLSDTDQAIALYVVPANADETYTHALKVLQEESGLESWNWHTASEAMPDLPAAREQ